MRVTTDPEEIDKLRVARERMFRRHMVMVGARAILIGLALGFSGFQFGWGLQHDAMTVTVFAALSTLCLLVVYWLTWSLG